MTPIRSFHDGALTGIAVSESGATLRLVDTEKRTYEVHLTGVEALCADEFRQGNIVFALHVVTGRRPEGVDLDSNLERLFQPPHPSAAAQYHETHAIFVERVLARIEAGTASYVTLESSYGCSLVAVCAALVMAGPLNADAAN